jgi:hypothetical protein
MPIQLVIDPSLQLSASRFAAAWNADGRTRALATAHAQQAGAAAYDPGLGEVVLLLGTQMALAVAGNALYDLIKDLLLKQGVRQPLHVAQHPQPDGGDLLIVSAEEEQATPGVHPPG